MSKNEPVAGASVNLQRYRSGAWQTVKTATTSTSGALSITFTYSATQTYRWSYSATSTYRGSSSGSVTK